MVKWRSYSTEHCNDALVETMTKIYPGSILLHVAKQDGSKAWKTDWVSSQRRFRWIQAQVQASSSQVVDEDVGVWNNSRKLLLYGFILG